MAVVSHVPHGGLLLMQLASAHADDTGSIMRLAAGGFRDTTRIAAGSPKLWCGIAFDNACALKSGLDEMASILGSFAAALETGDRETFTRLLAEATDARRALPAAWVPSRAARGAHPHGEPHRRRCGGPAPLPARWVAIYNLLTSTTSARATPCSPSSSPMKGDIGQLSMQLINAGFSVSFSPLMPKEYAHVE